jgi:glucose/arabinose dehydrogenase/PKD repeat protein
VPESLPDLKRWIRPVLPLVVGTMVLPVWSAPPVAAAPVDPSFLDEVVNAALPGWAFTNPSALVFAPDGHVFVAEKSGIVRVFDSLTDPTATVFADLRTNVHNMWDRGLLGLAVHPNFPATPKVYVLYTYDAPIGGAAPVWGSPGATSDPCPTPPGPTSDGCVVSGRLSALTAGAGDVATGPEQVLINDWCQQYPSHTIGDLAFGSDGALYVSAGDGASFTFTDFGQDGSPPNPCGDPPTGVGGTQAVPTAEGGALRAQDLRTTSDPTSLDGSILRLDPNTGAAMAGNPLIGSSDVNARRIIAHGLRNPFRFTFRPGTNEVWLGDVGWETWEEVNRIANPTAGVLNFGWPCIEGSSLHPGSYDQLNVCGGLYSGGGARSPYFSYLHGENVAGETCQTGSGSSISGLSFYTGTSYPPQFQGSLFLSDYSRQCIWVMMRGGNGLPDPTNVQPFINGAAGPVQLRTGQNGDLFYVDFNGGRLHRIVYQGSGSNRAPTAAITADPTSGDVPLTVSFSGTGSTDPDGDALTYAWDLDGDGAYDDSTAAAPSFTYTSPGSVPVGLRVRDPGALSDTDSVTISATGSVRYVSDLPFVSSTNGWGPAERDQSNGEQGAADGRTLTLNGDTYAKGLGTHAASDVRVAIPSGCTTFTAVIGLDDEVGANGSVTFQVVGDAASLFTSAIKRGSDAGQAISVNVSGRSQLRLVVGDGGDGTDSDHADWADAKLACGAVAGNAPPVPTIASPAATFTWHVGETIWFSGSATDAEDGTIVASGLDWSIVLFHCSSEGCHSHVVEEFADRASGSMAAPDHGYPSYLEVRLTATDSGGATTQVTRRIDPETVDLSFASAPSGLQVTVGSTTQRTPFTRKVIVGSRNSIGTPTPQTLRGTTYAYASWSDGGARVHNVTAKATATTYAAAFTSTDGSVRYISNLPFVSSTNGWGPVERDRSNGEEGASDGRTLTVNGKTYSKGIGTHAASDVRVTIPPGCTTFKAVIGVDDEVGANGSVRFEVYADSTRLFRSPVKRGADPGQAISVDVAGRSGLWLVVTRGGDNFDSDHADWASAKLNCG